MFMFELVPEPVWKTSIGNWSSKSPGDHLGGRAPDGFGDVSGDHAELGVDLRRG